MWGAVESANLALMQGIRPIVFGVVG